MRSFILKQGWSDQTFRLNHAFLVSTTTHSEFPGWRGPPTAHACCQPAFELGGLRRASMAATVLRELGALWIPNLRIWATQTLRVLPQSCIHTSASLDISRRWEKKNNIVYPPQLPGEPRRPAEIYHCRRQIKYSKDKMWYLAKLIRGMSIDQALAQLEFNDKKGAQIIKEVLLEAQDMAVRDHNVEFRSNLYIAESTSGRGQCLKRLRYHGRGRFGIMEKVYCHYFVKLVEGPPPLPEAPKTTVDHAKEYIQQLRSRTIIHTL